MKDELIKAILPIIETTKEGIAKGVDILMEQSPLLVKELMAWKFTISLVGFCAGILLLVSVIIIIKKASRWFKEDKGDPTARCMFAVMFSIMGGRGLYPCHLR